MRGLAASILLGGLVLPVLSGCLSDGASPAGDGPEVPGALRVGPAVWKAQLMKPVYDAIESTVNYIEAADGAQLSLTLHLPAGLASDARVPTLVQLTPYQSLREGDPDGSTTGPSGSWADLVKRGAAYVEADARGTGASEGCLDFGGSIDRSDAQVFFDWIISQPWSNGVVVTDGVSHPGMGAVVAHAAVPGLTAALAHAPVVSYYRDEWYQGAKFDGQANSIYQAIELEPTLYKQPEAVTSQAAPCTGQTAFDYAAVDGPFTAKWADRDLSRHVDPATTAPILLTQGFIDLNVQADHVQAYWDALPADFPKHMILGWWYHGWPDMTGHPAANTTEKTPTFRDLRLRWLEATLFNASNGLWAEPRVLVEDSTGVWHESDDWPLAPSETVTLWPSKDGMLGNATPAEGSASYDDKPGAVRGRWDGTHVAFRTEPLPEARLVNGAPVVTLVASSNVDATKWVAYLLDEAPDGSWERVTHGYADSHSWGPEAEWRAMVPGTEYTWTLTLLPTAVVVPKDHRLTLVVASQDPGDNPPGSEGVCFDDYRPPEGNCYSPTGIVPAATVGRATNTVHLGGEGTHVTLAWVDPEDTQKVPWPVPKK